MTARIYDRPDLDQSVSCLGLYVSGQFSNGKPRVAYEGRLQIHNAVGACTVRQIDGDSLPLGHRLYVDQATREVVLAWPDYETNAAPIANPGFESGATAWEAGAGWVIATENPPSGMWAAGYNNNRGESVISSTSRYPVYPGQVTNAKCKVRQGASSEGNAGASVLLEYRNQIGDVVARFEGNRVMSASKNRVYDSNVRGVAPDTADSVNVAANGIRYRENKILFVDDFEWDHVVAAAGVGQDSLFQITLQVSDSAGRSAIWKGSVRVVDVLYWNPTDAHPLVVLSDQDRRMEAVNTNPVGAMGGSVRAYQARSSGRRYVEFEWARFNDAARAFAGLFRANTSLSLFPGDYPTANDCSGVFQNGQFMVVGTTSFDSGFAPTAGSRVGVAIDFGTGRAWIRLDGHWFRNANPQNTPGGLFGNVVPAGDLFPAAFAEDRAADLSNQIRLLVKVEEMLFRPDGFVAWGE